MLLPLSVNNQSVDSSGITTDYREAINEYIWNGFEANASKVEVGFVGNGTEGVLELYIRDNGDGINYDELKDTFGAFLASKKRLLSLKPKSKVNKGKGRFSFTAFAEKAVWKTVYNAGNETKQYTISMSAQAKDVVECSDPEPAEGIATGTEVVLTDISSLMEESLRFDKIEPFLLKEFAWFLYLYKDRKPIIVFNGNSLDYSKFIDTEMSKTVKKTIDGHVFTISLVVWKEPIKELFCCYYFDSLNVLKDKSTTTFNRNTINFNHSVYVKSKFFDNRENVPDDCDDPRISMFGADEDKQTIKKLNKEIQTLIEKRIGFYLSKKADREIEEMVSVRKTFPTFPADTYGQVRKNDLKRVTKEIYRLQPMLFFKLKPIQEKSLLGLLNLLLSSEERENVLYIVEQIVELTPEQRSNFAEMLRKTALENVIETIKFLEERFRIIEILRTIVFDMPKFTNEREHIQRLVEHHFWLFGEQYNLASADQRMKKALEQYINILYGAAKPDAALEADAENERRMDIFLCNKRVIETSLGACQEENIIVELKAPSVTLNKTVYRQIDDYMDFIIRQPAFSSITRKWKFIAVCKDVDDYIRGLYKSMEDRGRPGLVHMVGDYEIYALTWGDILHSFEMRYRSLLEKLKYDREQIANELAEDVKNVDGREKVDNLIEIAVSE